MSSLNDGDDDRGVASSSVTLRQDTVADNVYQYLSKHILKSEDDEEVKQV